MTHHSRDVLDLSPVLPPILIKNNPEGHEVEFDDLVQASGMINVVSGKRPIRIIVTDLERDTRTPRPGSVTYGISSVGWDWRSPEFAREAIRRMAYGFHDWAAREVAARYHRDLKRERGLIPPHGGATSAGAAMKAIVDIIAKEPGCTVGRIARATGISQSNVSRGVLALVRKGQVKITKSGRETLCYISSKDEQCL